MKITKKRLLITGLVSILLIICIYYYLNGKSKKEENQNTDTQGDNTAQQTQEKLPLSNELIAESSKTPEDAAALIKSVQTENWSAHSNTSFEFKFEYPSDWKIDESRTDSSSWDNNEKARIVARSPECFNGTDPTDALAGCKSFDASVYKKGVMEEALSSYRAGSKVSGYNIGGKSWTKMLVPRDPANRRYYDKVLYYINYSENTYVIEHNLDNSGITDAIINKVFFNS